MLHDQYVMEKFKDGRTGKGTTVPNPKFNFKEPKFVKKDTDLEKISSLNISHPAREYLEKRQIKDLDYFYYCPKFKAGQINKRRCLTISNKIVLALSFHSETKKVTCLDTKADR